MKQETGTKKEKIQSIIIAVLITIILCGGAFFASALKYCKVDTVEVTMDEIGMTEMTTLLNDDNASIIYIARPSCGFCQQQEPIVKELILEYDLVVHYLNTDNLSASDMTKLFALDTKLFGEDGDDFGTPTTLIVKGGKIVDALVGYTAKAPFVDFLTKNNLIEK